MVKFTIWWADICYKSQLTQFFCLKVMSIGWNPFYENKKRAMETHIVHKFEEADLYDRQLKVWVQVRKFIQSYLYDQAILSLRPSLHCLIMIKSNFQRKLGCGWPDQHSSWLNQPNGSLFAGYHPGLYQTRAELWLPGGLGWCHQVWIYPPEMHSGTMLDTSSISFEMSSYRVDCTVLFQEGHRGGEKKGVRRKLD